MGTVVFASPLRASWEKSNKKCVHLGRETCESLEFWNILLFFTLEMPINLISTSWINLKCFNAVTCAVLLQIFKEMLTNSLACPCCQTTALLNQTLDTLVKLFSTWKFCPRTQNFLCLHLAIALPGGIVKLHSKCVSLHELSKQIPLEMWKALGNYLYNEL